MTYRLENVSGEISIKQLYAKYRDAYGEDGMLKIFVNCYPWSGPVRGQDNHQRFIIFVPEGEKPGLDQDARQHYGMYFCNEEELRNIGIDLLPEDDQ